jgi:hypothetical protein
MKKFEVEMKIKKEDGTPGIKKVTVELADPDYGTLEDFKQIKSEIARKAIEIQSKLKNPETMTVDDINFA